MRHHVYGTRPEAASVAILVKEAAFDVNKIKKAYIDEMEANAEGFIPYSLWYDDTNKCPADLAKDYLATVLTSVKQLGIKNILIFGVPEKKDPKGSEAYSDANAVNESIRLIRDNRIDVPPYMGKIPKM